MAEAASTTATIDRALRGLAIGRLVLGTSAWVAPSFSARVYGLQSTGDVVYLLRIFGARAIGLGASYLTAPDPRQRRRAQRIAVGVDTADTLIGLRSGLPRGVAAATTVLTGAYAAVGWSAVLRDLRVGDGHSAS